MDLSIDPTVAWGGRVLRGVIGGLGIGVLAASMLSTVPGAATAWNQSSAEGTLWQLLNGARVNNGVTPLQEHGALLGLAQWRSRDMVDRGYFSHDVAGTECQVYCWYDSNGISYVYAGENIAWNAGWSDGDSPVKAHEGLIRSPTHRANVLDAEFTHGAAGAFGRDGTSWLNGSAVEDLRMYTQLFLAEAAPPAPAAEPAPVAMVAPPVATPAPGVVSAAIPEADASDGSSKMVSDAGIAKARATDPIAVLDDPIMALEPASIAPDDEPAEAAELSLGGLLLAVATSAPAGVLSVT